MNRYQPIGLAVLACALLPLSLLGGVTHRDSITEQIDSVAGSNGLSRVSHQLYRDWLSQGTHQLVGFDLEANVQYHMLGACDADCSTLRFELLRPDGTRLTQGIGSPGKPLVIARPDHSGRHQLRVTMTRCSIQPCEWGVRVYRR